MHAYQTFLAAGFLILIFTRAPAQTPVGESLVRRVQSLEQLVKQLQTERSRLTWDDFGCVPDDPEADNGPMLSRILAEQGRSIGVAPVGKARDYYVSSTIRWPKRHGGALLGAGGYAWILGSRNPGVTRLIWNGPEGEPIIEGPLSGARVEQLVLQGALKAGQPRAGVGILLSNDVGPPTGFTTLDQIAYCNLDYGFKVDDQPRPMHGNLITHIAPLWYVVRIPYSMSTQQSVCHTIFNGNVKIGYERVFDIEAGGPINVYGLYVGACDGATLLRLGRSMSEVNIQGLNVDGNAKNLRYVDHGKYAGRVRIEGMVAKAATEAEPIVLEREGPTRYADVKIDCTNGVRWPKPEMQ
jgi:hypothetical protein